MKNVFGHFAYLLGGIKHIIDIHPYEINLKSEELNIEGKFVFGAVTNTTSLGGVLKLDKNDVSLNDGQFEVLLVRNPENPIDLKDVLNGLLRHKYDARHVILFKTSHLEIEFNSPASWTVDGEFGGRHENVVIDNLHNFIQIINKN